MVILLLFFFSGVTALIYEVIWSDYLTLLFGSTVQAQTVVLAVFMGGLALGNKLFGRFADQNRRPLVIYGCLELAIGVYALFFSFIYKLANHIFIPVGSHLLNHGNWLLLLNGMLSVFAVARPDGFDGRYPAGAGGLAAKKHGGCRPRHSPILFHQYPGRGLRRVVGRIFARGMAGAAKINGSRRRHQPSGWLHRCHDRPEAHVANP